MQSTEQYVRQLRDTALVFDDLVNQYIEQRNQLDPGFKCPAYDIDGTLNEAEFDFHDDTIVVQWHDTDRCGDSEYFRREFPFSDLWDPSWKERTTK